MAGLLDYGSLARFLMNPVQQVADPYSALKKGLFEPGATEGARAYQGGANPIPLRIEQAYQAMNEGKLSTKDFKNVVQQHNWYIDLRQPNASPVQIFDPSGNSHDLY